MLLRPIFDARATWHGWHLYTWLSGHIGMLLLNLAGQTNSPRLVAPLGFPTVHIPGGQKATSLQSVKGPSDPHLKSPIFGKL